MIITSNNLPNFICVGPGRSGTSWLYEMLLEHPGICMAKNIKETQFFNENYEKGAAWYASYFHYCPGDKIRGEISNRYIFHQEVAKRIKDLIPDCKIIVCLRNPYDRIKSVYTFKLREGALRCSFQEALRTMPELILENRYYTLLKPYYCLFNSDHILPLYFEDITKRPHELCREIYRFVGADESFVPSMLTNKVNAAVVPRFPFAAVVTKSAAQFLRTVRLHTILTKAKRSDRIKSIFFQRYDHTREIIISAEEREMIDKIIAPEVKLLESLLQKKLDHWRHA